MRNSITFAVILSSMMICSCKQSAQNASNVVVFNDDDAIEVNFEDVATNVRVVPIKSDSLIGGCYELQCYGDELFLKDNQHKSIYYFKNNEYKAKLNAVGRGPGEYTNRDDFTYCRDDKLLYIRTTGSVVMWYSVPDMSYQGKMQSDRYFRAIYSHDKNTLLLPTTIEDSIYNISLVDKSTGKIIKDVQKISGFAFARSSESLDGYNEESHVYSTLGEVNSVVRVSEEDECQMLFKYNFGDKSLTDKMTTFNDAQEALEYYKLVFYPGAKDYLCGGYFLKVKNDDISFWYTRIKPSLDNPYYCFYRHTSEFDTNLKGFHVPGLKNQIFPKCVTDDGYVTIFEGTSDMIIDPDTEPSPLAKQIIKAMDAQRDENPVLVYFDIK
jgi:hypothetical protein